MLNDYVIEKNIPSGPIFTDKNKKPLERQKIYNMLQTIAANAGIDKRKAHPHALRHCSFSRKMQNIFASFAKTYFKNRKRTF